MRMSHREPNDYHPMRAARARARRAPRAFLRFRVLAVGGLVGGGALLGVPTMG